MARFDLTDYEWSVIAPLLPNKARGIGLEKAARHPLGRDREPGAAAAPCAASQDDALISTSPPCRFGIAPYGWARRPRVTCALGVAASRAAWLW